MARILVFGDSVVWGAFDTKGGGWVERLKVHLYKILLEDSDKWYAPYNMGISGDTSKDLAKRIKSEIVSRLWKDDEIIMVIAIGVNDTTLNGLYDKPRVSQKDFKKNLQKVLAISKKYSSKIIFIGPTPVNEAQTLPWFEDAYFKNNLVEEYNEILKNFCSSNQLPFIELFDYFRKKDSKIYIDDGLHPNSKGHEKIFEIVLEALIKNKFIEV